MNLLLNRSNKLIIVPYRSYRFGRRVTISSYYVSPMWFDQKIMNQKEKPYDENLLNFSGLMKIKNKIFDEERDRQRSLITRYEKIEIKLERPFIDDQEYNLIMNANISTPYDCANHINQVLKERSALAVVNDNHYWDMHRPLKESCNLKLLHFKHPDCMPANYAFWRSCCMLLASVIHKAFKEEYSVKIISFPMSNLKSGSFICDVSVENLPNWNPTPHEIRSITSLLWDEASKEHIFERLDVNVNIVEKLFADNPYRIAHLEKNQERTEYSIYRIGQYIELSDGPMISNTNQIYSLYLSAIHPLKSPTGFRFYRFQGIALPKQLNINSFAYSLIKNRSKMLNDYDLK